MTQRKDNIAIIGAGLMGHGLAMVFANGGHAVRITDPDATARAAAPGRIAESLAGIGWDAAALDRIAVAPDLATCVAAADVVIEAAPERLPLKQAIFAEVERHAPAQALLASNTSVIPIGAIMAAVVDKQRVLGTHWWNPPFLVPLVEVVETAGTSPQTIARMMALLAGLGKVPVHVKKDVPGFVGNRLQLALWREAMALVGDGVCDAQTIDLVVKNSFGRRLAVLGPMENADLVGTDLALDILTVMLPHLDRSTTPHPHLAGLVREGKLGFKSNVGLRDWTDADKAATRARLRDHLMALQRMLGPDEKVTT